jgi:hypothetical protein
MNPNQIILVLLLGAVGASGAATEAALPGIRFATRPDRLRVEANGQLLTEYYYTNVPRPFCYPLIGPGGKEMTRNYPMKKVEGEQTDHPHHRSFWFTHGAVNGVDFWTESEEAGKIIHRGFTEVAPGLKSGSFKTRNDWLTKEGKLVCTDERTMTFFLPGTNDERVIDCQITMHAGADGLVFGDTKEGSFAIRVAETMPSKKGRGDMLNSEGDRGAKAWGKRARWCDYWGPVGDSIVGMAIFDHPGNPNYPTWWHARDYGLFAANPFGKHDFENLKDKTAGDVKVAANGSITFRYRVLLHRGTAMDANIAAKYSEYTFAPQSK